MMKIGDAFKLTDSALEIYGEEYRDRVFTVNHVATSKDDHPGYDESVNSPDTDEKMALYDAEDFDNSVYEYEVEQV